MKTLRTIAAILVAVALVFGPTVAFAAGETVTVATNSGTYAGAAVIQVTGTVTPAPASANTAVVVTTRGPAGAVDTGTATVATGTGAYSYTLVAGGSTMWVSGTFTVNATYGGPGGTGSTTTTFAYTATGTGGGGGSTAVSVQVSASTPAVAGQQEYVGILTSFAGNGSLAAVTFQTIHYHTPAGTLVTLCSSATGPAGCTGTFTTIHKGFYTINFTIPASAGTGGYFVHAWTNAPIVAGQGLASFTVQTAGSGNGVNPDTAALAQIQTSLTAIQTSISGLSSSIAVLTTGFGTLNTGIQQVTTNTNGLSGITAQLNTISTGVTGITNTLSGLSTNLTIVNGIGTQLSQLNTAVSNNQTYVLVVAALAAITLVLELAILVRKLS